MPTPQQCRYAKSHEWASEEAGTVRVGISDHAQKEITDVVFVELPSPGKTLAQGAEAGTIESVKAAFPVYAPVSGTVSAVNEKIAKNPELINQSPYETGWIYQLKISICCNYFKISFHIFMFKCRWILIIQILT